MTPDFAPNFNTRQAREKVAVERMLTDKDEYHWNVPLGAYNSDRVIGLHNPRKFVRVNGESHYLSGVEVFLHDTASQLLKVKTDPVTFLDIGGGAGATWSRLALCFGDEINDGKIAFVVSNLVFSPEDHLRKNGFPEGGNFLTRSKGLVHYVKGEFSQLKDKTIPLPNGTELPLEGSVDLGMERRSVTVWSKIPEVAILDIPPLLSPYGVYMVHKSDLLELNELTSAQEERERTEAIGIAHKLLQERFGLTKVTRAESGKLKDRELDYLVFKSQQAPLIDVN